MSSSGLFVSAPLANIAAEVVDGKNMKESMVPERSVVSGTPRPGTLPTMDNVPAAVSNDSAPQLAPPPVAQATAPSTL